ncbi:hypothetical protein BJX99DRAFT_265411 [Aspergillus californicus]
MTYMTRNFILYAIDKCRCHDKQLAPHVSVRASLLGPRAHHRTAGIYHSHDSLAVSHILTSFEAFGLKECRKKGFEGSLCWWNGVRARFAHQFQILSDEQVAKRYHYGQIRLSRLNWAVRIFRPRDDHRANLLASALEKLGGLSSSSINSRDAKKKLPSEVVKAMEEAGYSLPRAVVDHIRRRFGNLVLMKYEAVNVDKQLASYGMDSVIGAVSVVVL